MKLRFEWTYKPLKNKKPLYFESEYVTVEEALLLSEDIEKTGRVKELKLVDDKGHEWTKKEIKKYIASFEDEPVNITAYFDGGFQKETMLSSAGVVIYYEKNGKSYRIRKNQVLEQLDSNNEAEYAALWVLLLELEELGVHHTEVTIKGDSLVVINQMTEEWPCYEEDLLRWTERIDEKVKQLGLIVSYAVIPRKDNQEADTLASQALNGEEIASKLCLDSK